MNILMVDDSNFKIKDIKSILEDYPNINLDISNCKMDGIRKISSKKYDFLILDMCFPDFEDDRAESNNGIKFLKYLERKNIKIKTVIYTSDSSGLDCTRLLNEYDNLYDILDANYYIKDNLLKFLNII